MESILAPSPRFIRDYKMEQFKSVIIQGIGWFYLAFIHLPCGNQISFMPEHHCKITGMIKLPQELIEKKRHFDRIQRGITTGYWETIKG